MGAGDREVDENFQIYGIYYFACSWTCMGERGAPIILAITVVVWSDYSQTAGENAHTHTHAHSH